MVLICGNKSSLRSVRERAVKRCSVIQPLTGAREGIKSDRAFSQYLHSMICFSAISQYVLSLSTCWIRFRGSRFRSRTRCGPHVEHPSSVCICYCEHARSPSIAANLLALFTQRGSVDIL